jgi:SAM-dependent methyltransferase
MAGRVLVARGDSAAKTVDTSGMNVGGSQSDRREQPWESTLPSLHRLRSRPSLVDRVSWLELEVTGKRVIHLGFVDAERTVDKTAAGAWLHERLSKHANHVVGIDLDAAAVGAAQGAGYEAYSCDLQDPAGVRSLQLEPAELVVAGELIEHLDCPGRFLEAVHPLLAPGGSLVLTTPNATALTNMLVAFSLREWSSPHHVTMYSWRTLATLLDRHAWQLEDLLFYYRGKRTGPEAAARPRLAAAFNSYERAIRPLLRLFPTVADGLIVVAKRVGDTPAVR